MEICNLCNLSQLNFYAFNCLFRKSSVEEKQEAEDGIENPKLSTLSPSLNSKGKSRENSNTVELTFFI